MLPAPPLAPCPLPRQAQEQTLEPPPVKTHKHTRVMYLKSERQKWRIWKQGTRALAGQAQGSRSCRGRRHLPCRSDPGPRLQEPAFYTISEPWLGPRAGSLLGVWEADPEAPGGSPWQGPFRLHGCCRLRPRPRLRSPCQAVCGPGLGTGVGSEAHSRSRATLHLPLLSGDPGCAPRGDSGLSPWPCVKQGWSTQAWGPKKLV